MSSNVPQLRFPEFEDNGEWEKRNLSELINKLDAGVSVNSVDQPAKNDEMAILKTSCVFTNVFDITQNKAVTKEKEISRLKEPVTANTIIISRMNTPALVGANAFVPISNNNIFLPDRLWSAKIDKNANSFWVSILLSSKKIRSALSNRATGTSNSMKNITKGDVLTLSVNVPSFPEQTRIATFLTSVDEKLQALKTKKELLEQYKKGAMQKLFSQELRFKQDDGSAFPDWEEKKLGEVTKYYDGTHQTPKYVENGIPFYSVEHVTANQFVSTKYISPKVFEKENKRVKIEKGDILMTRIGSIGVAKYIDWDVEASFYVSLALIKGNGSFDSLFLSYAINSESFQKELWKRTIHVAFPKKINLGEIGNCKVLIPSLPEQQKIADFLSSIDESIENVGEQIEALQEWKKGLLQKMFV